MRDRLVDYGSAIFVGLVAVAIAVGVVLGLNAIFPKGEDFTSSCLRDHPTAHVVHTNRTYYCLGPNGELWAVQ